MSVFVTHSINYFAKTNLKAILSWSYVRNFAFNPCLWYFFIWQNLPFSLMSSITMGNLASALLQLLLPRLVDVFLNKFNIWSQFSHSLISLNLMLFTSFPSWRISLPGRPDIECFGSSPAPMTRSFFTIPPPTSSMGLSLIGLTPTPSPTSRLRPSNNPKL